MVKVMSDYINREDALRMVRGLQYKSGLSVEKAFDVIPSADVVTVGHGRWIEGTHDIICSKCETVFSDEIGYMIRDCLYSYPHYCPWCGAKMTGGDD